MALGTLKQDCNIKASEMCFPPLKDNLVTTRRNFYSFHIYYHIIKNY